MFGKDVASFRDLAGFGKEAQDPQTSVKGASQRPLEVLQFRPPSYVQTGTNYSRGVASLHSLVALRPPPVLS